MVRKLVLAAIVALAACAAPSEYQARSSGETGYAEERLSADTWRVEYSGDVSDSAEVVEARLLRRAAELTLQSGYDWFSQHGQSVGEEIVVQAPRRPEAVSAVWRPRWRQRSGYRWTDWDPRGAEAGGLETSPPAVQRIQASAEIVMGRAPAPAGAFDARTVLAAN